MCDYKKNIYSFVYLRFIKFLHIARTLFQVKFLIMYEFALRNNIKIPSIYSHFTCCITLTNHKSGLSTTTRVSFTILVNLGNLKEFVTNNQVYEGVYRESTIGRGVQMSVVFVGRSNHKRLPTKRRFPLICTL